MFKIRNCLALVAGSLASAALFHTPAADAASESVVYSFCSQGGTVCTDGAYPYAGLIDVKGTLYGRTSVGGTGNGGTVFKVTP